MFPFIGSGPVGPRVDDRAWLSYMYPVEGFQDQTATIRGQVFRRSGGGLSGANVVAMPIDVDGEGLWTERPAGLVSVVSDFLLEGLGQVRATRSRSRLLRRFRGADRRRLHRGQ